MKKITKVLLVLLVALMMLPLTVSAVSDNETKSNNLSIVISTDKNEYKVTNVAKITATITNTGSTDIENITAQAVFDELAPVSAKSSETNKNVAVLKPGESFSFTYKATLNSSKHNLNFLQKIILFLVRFFNGGYTANNIDFDVVSENVTEIKFGKFTAENVIQVGYTNIKDDTNNDNNDGNINTDDNNDTKQPTYEELINGVDVDEIYEYEQSDISIDEDTGTKFINNIIIIMFEDNCTDETKAEIVNSINGTVVGGDTVLDELYVEIEKSSLEQIKNICSEISEMNGVLDASYDEFYEYSFNKSSFLNDPFQNGEENNRVFWYNNSFTNNDNNWWCLATNMRNAWGYNEYFNCINIGIVDSGFFNSHEDLKINVISKENSIENHGTHVAGLIGATHNDKGIAGVVNYANLYGYDAQNSKNTYSKKQIYKGLVKLITEYNCKIVNFSIGNDVYLKDNNYYSDKNFKYKISENKINQLGKEASEHLCKLLSKGYDFVIVQSAGNGAKNTSIGIDAQYSGFFASINADNCYSNSKITSDMIKNRIIVVANAEINSTDFSYQLHYSSNGNSNQVDVAAPGTNIYSTLTGLNDNTTTTNGALYGKLTGTSMSAPIVSGVAGLIWSVNENFNGAQIKNIICKTAQEGNAVVYDNPDSPTTGNLYMVNAELAVQEAIRKTYSTCTIKGSLIDENHEPLTNVNYVVKNTKTRYETTGITNKDGLFSIALPIGSYKIVFSKGATELEITTKELTYNEILELNEQMYIGKSCVTGIVKNASNNKPLENITITAINLERDKTEAEILTDENGSFSMDVPLSNSYLFMISNDEFDGTDIYISVDDLTTNLGEIIITSNKHIPDDYTVTYTVLGETTEQPIPNVVVNVTEQGDSFDNVIESVTTDENGQITLTLPEGDYVLSLSHDSYQSNVVPVTFNAEITSGNIYLTPTRKATVSGECGANGDNVKWVLYDDGELVISGSGDMADYEGTDRPPWNYIRGNISKATIESGVTSIGIKAFNDCYHLRNILIPNTIKSIGTDAFWCCCLDNIVIPNSVTTIEDGAFNGYRGIGELIIPDSVTYIGESAFSYCSYITNIILPKNITTIKPNTFYSCTQLKNITIPDSVTSIGVNAFTLCEALENVVFPKNITSIDDGAFEGCSNLKSITIPDSVTYIGESAFSYCSYLTSITLSENITTIKPYTFYSCKYLKNITIPNNVTSIGVNAFALCKSIENVVLSKNITSINNGVFQGCSTLESITIPYGVTKIMDCAFSDCTNLVNIEIPDTVTYIEYTAFDNTKYYNTAWENDILYVSNHLIKARTTLNGEYEIKNGCISISPYAFSDCTQLTSIKIPDSVTSISHSIFNGCTNLKELTMPISAHIEYSLGCSNLETITLTKGNGTMQDFSFSSVSSSNGLTYYQYTPWYTSKNTIQKIIIEEGVTYIGDYAFYQCSNLTSITIPKTITEFGYHSFVDTNSLSDVYYNGTKEDWNKIEGVFYEGEDGVVIHYNA